jgi:ferritin-like metal-binding protein YciE
MEGVIAEGAEMIKEEADPEAKDAGLISAAQRVEHYEMDGYGTARTYAELLSDIEAAELLQTTLREETESDKKLTKPASSINVAALSHSLTLLVGTTDPSSRRSFSTAPADNAQVARP